MSLVKSGWHILCISVLFDYALCLLLKFCMCIFFLNENAMKIPTISLGQQVMMVIEERKKSYLARSAGIQGDWKKNKYSANSLARALLWSSS